MEFRELLLGCGLDETSIARLVEVEKQLPLMADLANADIFIDIPLEKDTALVAAHARPGNGASVYERDIVGEYAYAEREPAVFHAVRMGVPMCDIKAITQEKQTVRQNAAPITDANGRVIAVLIREKDISGELRQERKFDALAKSYEENGTVQEFRGETHDTAAFREMHHRVKNSLQLVASILNMQARKADDPGAKEILKENVARVLSIAAIHDILSSNPEDMHRVSSASLLEQLRRNLLELIPPEKEILLSVEAEDVELSADAASSVAIVVTELVTNAFLHAFEGRSRGKVEVSFLKGILFHTVTVTDDGIGFDPDTVSGTSLGLNIVRATVHDKLKGRLHVGSDQNGTKISFDLKNE